MGFLSRFKVKTRLIISFLVIVLFIAIVGVIGIISLGAANNNSREMYTINFNNSNTIKDIGSNIEKTQMDVMMLVFEPDTNTNEATLDDIASLLSEKDKMLSTYENNYLSTQEKQVFSDFKNQLQNYLSMQQNIIKLVEEKNFTQATLAYKNVDTLRNEMTATLNKLIQLNSDDAKLKDASNLEIFQKAILKMQVILGVGFIFALFFAVLTSNYISRGLKKCLDFSKALADGDLTYKIKNSSKDEIGELCRELNSAGDINRNLVKNIISHSHDLSASSEELSATALEIASKLEKINGYTKEIVNGTAESSSTSEEISASMQEVDSSVNELASKSTQGSDTSNQINERAVTLREKGQSSSNKANILLKEKQEKIKKAIEEGKVVDQVKNMADVIANISAQTNLLALNAAIEAARAGDQGRGFAVVADEVRQLAEQSAQTVSSIQGVIVKVQNAFKNLSQNSQEVLTFIEKNIEPDYQLFVNMGDQYGQDAKFMSSMSEDIASMSEEISATVEQVNNAVSGLAEVSQQSAQNSHEILESIDETTSAMQEVAKTSQNQAELALKLNELVQKYKI